MLSRFEIDVCKYFWESEFSRVLAPGHISLIRRKFFPMLSFLDGFVMWMIMDLCHMPGICPVEINRLKILVR